MTDDRVGRRAAEALPEERSAGVEDAEGLAASVLAESDERQADGAAPGTYVEHRRSEDA
jgi:hypothetical protein